MRVTIQFQFLLLCAGALNASAQLEVLAAEQPQAVFPGEGGTVRVFFRNAGAASVEVALSTRFFQISSSLSMPAGEMQLWKTLTVPGGETVVESAHLKFPNVRAATRFQVHWFDGAGQSPGQTLVTVYPTNMLRELAALAGKNPFGIYDPQERITSLLKAMEIEFADLRQDGWLDSFHDRLAIVGPFDDREPLTTELRKRVDALVARRVSVVLIAPRPRAARVMNATILLVSGRLVIIAPETISSLNTNPLAQETLLQCARLALDPNLPLTETEP